MAWWALAMVFGSLAGICLVGYAYDCGYEERRPTVKGYIECLRGVLRARREAIKDTGKLLGGENGRLLAFLIAGALLVIATDRIMLSVVNLSAIPVTFLARHLGRNHRVACGLSIAEARGKAAAARNARDESGICKAVIITMATWISIAGVVLGVLYWSGLWKPQQLEVAVQ